MNVDLPELQYVSFRRKKKAPGITARERAKRRRDEMSVAKVVRAACVARDGFCRMMGLTPCNGQSEWAHLAEGKRARTRGMQPWQRHRTSHSAMLCTKHHAMYDTGEIQIAMTDKGADGKIRVQLRERVIVC